MIQKYGVSGSELGGVFFTEKEIPGARPVRRVRVQISRQNSNLSEVKEKMAAEARSAQAAAIMNFRYGQARHPWWELLIFKWDTESWYGEGDMVTVA